MNTNMTFDNAKQCGVCWNDWGRKCVPLKCTRCEFTSCIRCFTYTEKGLCPGCRQDITKDLGLSRIFMERKERDKLKRQKEYLLSVNEDLKLQVSQWKSRARRADKIITIIDGITTKELQEKKKLTFTLIEQYERMKKDAEESVKTISRLEAKIKELIEETAELQRNSTKVAAPVKSESVQDNVIYHYACDRNTQSESDEDESEKLIIAAHTAELEDMLEQQEEFKTSLLEDLDNCSDMFWEFECRLNEYNSDDEDETPKPSQEKTKLKRLLEDSMLAKTVIEKHVDEIKDAVIDVDVTRTKRSRIN